MKPLQLISILSWNLVEEHSLSVRINGVDFDFEGLCAEKDGNYVSASGLLRNIDNGAVRIALWELLERMALVEALQSEREFESLCGSTVFSRDEIFPPGGDNFKFSLSNGVAISSSEYGAMHTAQKELIERDAVLRSWYGGTDIRKIRQRQLQIECDWRNESAQLSHYLLDSALDRTFKVVVASLEGVGGSFPRLIAFGADRDLALAIERATEEVLQRYVFLSHDGFEQAELTFSPTPAFHQEYYLAEKGQKLIEQWLGRAQSRESRECPEFDVHHPDLRAKDAGEFINVDLTPSQWTDHPVRVVKSLHGDAVPLVFGRYHPLERRTEFLDFHPHPIA